MGKMKKIKTNGLLLLPLQEDMHVDIFKWMTRNEIMYYVGMQRPECTSDTLKWVQERIEKSNCDIEYTWMIRIKDSYRIGWVAAKDIGEKTYLLTYLEDSKFWNKGYMTEAVNGVIEFLFTRCDAERVMATCHPENSHSEKVMQKLGMHRVWLPKTFAEENGRTVYQHCYVMERFHT